MAQFVELPNGDSIEFPDDMSADAMSAAIAQSFPEFAPKAEPPSKTVAGTASDVGLSLMKSAISVPETIVGLADIPTGGAVGRAVENAGVR